MNAQELNRFLAESCVKGLNRITTIEALYQGIPLSIGRGIYEPKPKKPVELASIRLISYLKNSGIFKSEVIP